VPTRQSGTHSDTPEERSALLLSQKALNEERARLVGRINVLNERLTSLPDSEPANKKHRIILQISQGTKDLQALGNQTDWIQAKLAEDLSESAPLGPTFAADRGTNWDTRIERTIDEYRDHQNLLNRFVGGANAGLLGLTLTFISLHLGELREPELKLLTTTLLLAFGGLLLSPTHSIVGLTQTGRIHAMTTHSYGEVHWARMVGAIAASTVRFSRIRGAILVFQYGLWISAAIVGALGLREILNRLMGALSA
jgi:hypothetical protein